MAPFLEFKVGIKRKFSFSRFHAKSHKNHFRFSWKLRAKIFEMLVFHENLFCMNICFPESFSKNILKIGEMRAAEWKNYLFLHKLDLVSRNFVRKQKELGDFR